MNKIVAFRLIDDDLAEYCEVEKEVRNNEFSFHGTCGMVMKEDYLERLVDDYWNDIDVEEEWGYLWEERGHEIPVRPNRDDFDNEGEYIKVLQDYNDEMDEYYANKSIFFEDLEEDLRRQEFPYERHIDFGDYVFTVESYGQIDMTLCKPENDLISTSGENELKALCMLREACHMKPFNERDNDRINKLLDKFPNAGEFIERLEMLSEVEFEEED